MKDIVTTHNSQLPQEKQPQHNPLCNYVMFVCAERVTALLILLL